jgi:hypothetical protein
METEGALLSGPVPTGESTSATAGSPSTDSALPDGPGAAVDVTQEVTYATAAAPSPVSPERADKEGGATAATKLDQAEWPTLQETSTLQACSNASKGGKTVVDSGAEPVVIPETQLRASPS